MPAVGPGPGQAIVAIIPPCRACRNSCVGINVMLLRLGPQAHGHAGCFLAGSISVKGTPRGTAAPLWFAGASPAVPEAQGCLGRGFPPPAATEPRISQGPQLP